MRLLLCGIATLLFAFSVAAQKVEQGFDSFFKPTQNAPRYHVVTEQKDTLWHRQAFYLPEGSLAMEGWYKDSICTNPHGLFTWYHTSRFPKEQGVFNNGRKQGSWLVYNEEGYLTDSLWYEAGRLKGISLGWYRDGMPKDSANFDGSGNGVRVSWHPDGMLSSAGRIINDTAKHGRWKYYHANGKLMATEDYVAGDRKQCNCYNEMGKQLDSLACAEQDADFPGGLMGWRRFLERNLKADVPVRNKAPDGMYTVVMQFVVDKNGTLTDIRALTKFGYGMEAEVERMLRQSPPWIPAKQFGRNVKAYRKQPVTFGVY